MRSLTCPLLLLALLGCTRTADREEPAEADHRHPAGTVASAVVVDTVTDPVAGVVTRYHGDPRAARMIPLRPMTADSEVLFGDPGGAGEPFVIRIRELPGTIVPPHSHPVDEHITVVQGTWYFGIGDEYDPARLRALPAGSYAFVPAGTTMFAHSPEPAVVQVHGVGPFDIHWKHGMVTLDDAGAESAFRFRRGDRVSTPRGRGRVRWAGASGSLIQYEIEGEDGSLHTVQEHELRRQ